MDRKLLPEFTDEFLSVAERRLVRCAKEGRIWHPKVLGFEDGTCADFRGTHWIDKPVDDKNTREKFVLRPKVIRYLITGTSRWRVGKPWPLHARGVLICNAYIDGNLDLEGCELLSQLWLVNCQIKGFVNFQDAHTKTIGFDGTRIDGHDNAADDYGTCRAFNGRRLHADGDVFFRLGFKAGNVVLLAKSHIAGSLHCELGKFHATDQVFEKRKTLKVWAPGEVNNFSALDCSASEIAGNVMLSNGFESTGGTDFSYARIFGGLRCTDGKFTSAYAALSSGKQKDFTKDVNESVSDDTEYMALNCQHTHIDGNVSLCCGYVAKGSSDFLSAQIGGSLRCTGGAFSSCLSGRDRDEALKDYRDIDSITHAKFDALKLYGCKIGGGLHFTRVIQMIGNLNLMRAGAQVLHDDGTAWWGNAQTCLLLSGFTYHSAGWRIVPKSLHNCVTTDAGGEARQADHVHVEDSPTENASRGANQMSAIMLASHVAAWLQKQPRQRASYSALAYFVGQHWDGRWQTFWQCFRYRSDKNPQVTRVYMDNVASEEKNGKKKFEMSAISRSWVQASRVLRQMGLPEAARHLSFLREDFRTRQMKCVWGSLLRRIFLGWTIGYGYKPGRSLLWAIPMVLLGWFVFATAANHGYMEPKQNFLQVQAGSGPDKVYTKFNALSFSLDSFLPVVQLGQDSAWEAAVTQVHGTKLSGQDMWARSVLGQNYKIHQQESNKSADTASDEIDTVYGYAEVNGCPTVEARCPTPNSSGWGVETMTVFFKAGGHRVLHWLEAILGWLLVSVGVANFSRIIGNED